MNQLAEAEARLGATFTFEQRFTFLPLGSQATSTEQVSQRLSSVPSYLTIYRKDITHLQTQLSRYMLPVNQGQS
jgi:hypothetical protein